MTNKRVLIDLSVLKHPYCGLGQIALNYIRLINATDTAALPFRIVLLVPKSFYGCCGDKVDYVPRKRIYHWLPFLYPKVDVWHAIHQLSPFMPYSADTKYLLTIHDFNFMYEKTDKIKEKYRRRVQHKIERADYITCISHFTATELASLMHKPAETPVQVIYNGVEFAPEGAKEAKPSAVLTDKPFLFSIGEIKEKKNFLAIIRMMRQMPDYRLYIAGNDQTAYADTCRRYIKKYGINNAFLLGIVNNAERQWLYNHCTAFLFPSLFEGFGLPVIEAMGHRKPVFSSSATSLNEIGGNHVAFFEDFVPEHMAEQVMTQLPSLQTDTALDESEAYARSFSYDKHFQSYIQLYKHLLDEQ